MEVIQIWLQIQTILNKNKSKNNLERVGDFIVANQPVKSPTTPDGLNILYTPLASLPQVSFIQSLLDPVHVFSKFGNSPRAFRMRLKLVI
jgi:hypothetical protein